MIIRAELHKAGWRLADLLEKAVTPGNDQSATLSVPSASASASPSAGIPPAPSATPQASAPSGSPYGAYPANYKEIVTNWLEIRVPDPANTQIHWQPEPKPADLPGLAGRKLYGYLVIFSTSSKNHAGLAGRRQTHAALIHDGQVVKANDF